MHSVRDMIGLEMHDISGATNPPAELITVIVKADSFFVSYISQVCPNTGIRTKVLDCPLGMVAQQ
jgi:hypothetical protein